MVFFPNEMIELWEYTETGGVDAFLDDDFTYVLEDTVKCDIQPMSPKDSLMEFGKILEDTFKIYIDKDVHITDTMVLRIVGKKDTFKIIGSPMCNNHILPHIKIVVQRQRKPLRLG